MYGVQRDERICTMCDRGEVEDVEHGELYILNIIYAYATGQQLKSPKCPAPSIDST